MTSRCAWVPADDQLYVDYHDQEWGVPIHDDRVHFEFLILEGAQAGLSWSTILKRRDGYRHAFANFDYHQIAKFTEVDYNHLIINPAIIRNKLKIRSAVNNAQKFLEIQKEFASFDHFIWQFVGNKPIINHWRSIREVPAKTKEAEALSRDLVKRGFKFVGPTIIYAHMQACGLVNDHTTNCFRYRQITPIK